MIDSKTLCRMTAVLWFVLLVGPLFINICFGAGVTDIAIGKAPEHEIRFTSGKTIYVEALVDGRWVGQAWAADGQIGSSVAQVNISLEANKMVNRQGKAGETQAPAEENSTKDAFQIRIVEEPLHFATPALLSAGWQWVSAIEEPKTDRGARHFVVELENDNHPIHVRIHTLLDGTPVLTRWLEITNTSGKAVGLTSLSPWSGQLWPQGQEALRLGYFTRSWWTWEGWFDWKTLPWGKTLIECDMGQSHDDPFFILQNENKAEYFIGHLAWSANWHMEFNRKPDNSSSSASLLFKTGPSAINVLRVIDPGETVKSPAVHLGHVKGDLDSAVQAMHDHIRHFVTPTRKPELCGLIQLGISSDIGYYNGEEFNEVNMRKMIDVAAALGAELFILDHGWWKTTGDWYPDPSRFPNGLNPIREYARSKGMLFGLFTEMEGGRGNVHACEIVKKNPGWMGPKQVLRAGRPEVAAWMETEICRFIDEYKVDLYRLDYNPGTTCEGPEGHRHGWTENSYWRYYDNIYGIYERIHKKYPDVILQQASAGGCRNDLGMASRFHELQLTDGTWLPRAIQTYSGLSLALPPETLENPIGVLGYIPGYGPPLDTYLRMTFTLSTPHIYHGVVAPTVDELKPQDRERYLHYGKIYKEFIRPLWPVCKMYHHAPISAHGGVESSDWFAMEYTAQNGDKGWATIVHLIKSDSKIYVFKPRGLDPSRRYRVTFDSTGRTETVDGRKLANEGVSLRLEATLSSELLLFEAE